MPYVGVEGEARDVGQAQKKKKKQKRRVVSGERRADARTYDPVTHAQIDLRQ